MAINDSLKVDRRKFLTATAAGAMGLAGSFAVKSVQASDRLAPSVGSMGEGTDAGEPLSVGYWAGELAVEGNQQDRVVSAKEIGHDQKLSNTGAIVSVRGLFNNLGPRAIPALELHAHFHVEGHAEPTVPVHVWSSNSSPVRFLLPPADDGALHLTVSHARDYDSVGLGKRMLDAIVLGKQADPVAKSSRQEHSCRIGAERATTLGALRSGTYFIALGQGPSGVPPWDTMHFTAADGASSEKRLMVRSEAGLNEASFPYFVIVVKPA